MENDDKRDEMANKWEFFISTDRMRVLFTIFSEIECLLISDIR